MFVTVGRGTTKALLDMALQANSSSSSMPNKRATGEHPLALPLRRRAASGAAQQTVAGMLTSLSVEQDLEC